MEDYVDDTLEKSKKWDTHLEDLSVILDHMEQFQLRLNPKKCAFGITSGKLLGYIISAWKGPGYHGYASSKEY